ncbi:MAG: hypothetical protein ACT4NY_21190 [Pseudonocardiales bacterium]
MLGESPRNATTAPSQPNRASGAPMQMWMPGPKAGAADRTGTMAHVTCGLVLQ